MQKQQGDVNLEMVSEIPSGAKKIAPKERGYILAEGEHTGHMHRLEDAEGIEMFEKDGALYVKVSRAVQLRHEEHNPVTLEPGIWKSWGVREYDHFEEEARRVQD